MEGIEWNHFMTILLLDLYFKINGWISRAILRVLVKNSLNLISFSSIPPNFKRNENLRFWRNKKEWVFPFTHSIPSHSNFLLSPLKFSIMKREEYNKIFILISFHSLFPNKELVTNQISPRIFRRSKH